MEGQPTGTALGGGWELGDVVSLASGVTAASAARASTSGPTEATATVYSTAGSATTGPTAPDGAVEAVRRSARVDHRDLLAVFDVGVVDDRVCVVTERWTDLAPQGPLDEADLRELAAVLAGGLGALHRAGIDHGGLHRGSLRFADGRWKLAPAGLAPLLVGAVAPYRPPGLNVMEPPSPAADMWNVGMILHEFGTGQLLRPGQVPTVPGAPVIDHLVHRLLLPDPGTRIGPDELLAVLDDTALGQRPDVAATMAIDPATIVAPDVATPAATRAAGTSATPNRSRSVLLAAIGVVLAAVVVGVGALLLNSQGTGTTDGDVTEAAAPASDSDDTDESTPPESTTTEAPRTGEVSTSELLVGDCVDLGIGQGVIDFAELVGCDQSHTAEVFVVSASSPGSEIDYPGRRTLLDTANTICGETFERYVGSSVFTTVLNWQALVPSFTQWEADDRVTVCLATRYDGGPLDQSVAGAYSDFRLVSGTETSIGKIFPAFCFESDGPLDGTGKRQPVVSKACTEPHTQEVIEYDGFPTTEEDESSLVADADRYDELREYVRERCAERWAELEPLAEVDGGTVSFILPDPADWQLGDRLYQCYVTFPEPVLSSIALAGASAGEDDDGS